MYEHGLGRRLSRSVRTFLSAVIGALAATVAIDSDPASDAIVLSLSSCVCGSERLFFFFFINKKRDLRRESATDSKELAGVAFDLNNCLLCWYVVIFPRVSMTKPFLLHLNQKSKLSFFCYGHLLHCQKYFRVDQPYWATQVIGSTLYCILWVSYKLLLVADKITAFSFNKIMTCRNLRRW